MSVKRNTPCPCGSGKRYKSCCALLQNDFLASNKELACSLVDQGNAMLGEEKHEGALKLYQEALAIYPEYARAHYNIGVVFQRTGRKEDAVISYQKALSIKPDDVEAYVNLGVLLKSQNNMKEAATCYRKALAIKPDHAQAYNNLGAVYLNQGRPNEAEDCFLKALSIKPDYAKAYNNLGAFYLNQGRPNEAEDCFLKALSVKPDNFRTHFALADIYERKNLTYEARQHLEKSLNHDCNNPEYLLLEVKLLYREEDFSGALEKLHFLESSAQNDLKSLAAVYFLFGKIYDRIGEEDNAFDYFIKANNINSKEAEKKNINPARYLDKVIQLKRKFSKDWLASWSSISLNDSSVRSPVFLVGFPRSGTTLLDQVLSTHPSIEVVEEEPIIETLIEGIDQFAAGFPDSLAYLNANDIYKLQKEYFETVKRLLPDNLENKVIIDKFPLNLTQVGMINRIFPDAQIVLALRHPYDVCLSNFMQSFVPTDAMANFYTLENTAKCYSAVMDLWQKYANLLNINYQIIKYENVVDDFENEIKGLLSFLSIPWDEELLNYHQHIDKRKSVNTPSYQDISSPIFSRAKYRWKRYEKYFEDVKEILAPHVEYFGYTVE